MKLYVPARLWIAPTHDDVVAEVGRVVFEAGAGGRGAPRPLWAANHLTCWGKRGMKKYNGGKS